MSGPDHERRVLDQIIPNLVADGYSVFVRPPRQMLPPFMRGYAPDAIALGAPKNLAIEVVREGGGRKPIADGVHRRFAESPDWELRVYAVSPAGDYTVVAAASREAIDAAIARIENLTAVGHREAALLLGWATLEAIVRNAIPGKLEHPQSSNQLVEIAATEGVVTPDEADRLRSLVILRNQIAHGALETRIEQEDIAAFVAILKLVMQENAAAAASH